MLVYVIYEKIDLIGYSYSSENINEINDAKKKGALNSKTFITYLNLMGFNIKEVITKG